MSSMHYLPPSIVAFATDSWQMCQRTCKLISIGDRAYLPVLCSAWAMYLMNK